MFVFPFCCSDVCARKVDQYDNPKNPEAHYLTTGPEIWAQMGGRIDWFVASGSTGGTVTGIGKYLKERDPRIRVGMSDPVGSIYYEYFHTRQPPKDAKGCTYLVEGIGEDHVCKAIDFNVVDKMWQFRDAEIFPLVQRLAREEGILAGGSSGANLFAAVELAKTLKGAKTRTKTRKNRTWFFDTVFSLQRRRAL